MIVRLVRIAVAALLAVPALAQTPDPDLPPVDPPGVWRQMTLDDATSDSKCVGRFETALCAVETVIACFTRGEDRLCAEARMVSFLGRLTARNRGNLSRELYRVVRTERLTDDSIPDIPRWTSGVSPGDIRIDVQIRQCTMHDDGENCSPPIFDPNIYTVRKTEPGWRIVDWGTPDIRWPGRKKH